MIKIASIGFADVTLAMSALPARKTMFTKTKMALAAALVLGLASAVQAGERDDPETRGGSRVGPLGQTFDGVNPALHRAIRAESFGQAANVYGYAALPHQPSRKRARSRR